MKKEKNKFLITLFVLILLLISCKSNTVHKKTEVAEQTAFYTLVLVKDSILNKTKASIKNLTIVDTKIRYTLDEVKLKDPNFLKIEVIYKNNKIINVATEHPFFKRFDLYSESGEIESKLISLTQGEVTFRIPYFAEYKKITIMETVNFKEAKPIILKNEK